MSSGSVWPAVAASGNTSSNEKMSRSFSPASASGRRSVSQDVSSDVRLSMTRNARAWRAGMVTTGAAVNPSEMAGRVNGSAVLRCAPALRVTLARLAAAQSALMADRTGPILTAVPGAPGASWGVLGGSSAQDGCEFVTERARGVSPPSRRDKSDQSDPSRRGTLTGAMLTARASRRWNRCARACGITSGEWPQARRPGSRCATTTAVSP